MAFKTARIETDSKSDSYQNVFTNLYYTYYDNIYVYKFMNKATTRLDFKYLQQYR